MANFLFLEQDLLSQHHKARGTHMLLNSCATSENRAHDCEEKHLVSAVDQ